MIGRLRRTIAIGLAVLVAVLTLGRARLNWTGRPAAASGAEDPDRPLAEETRTAGARAPRPR